MHYKETGVTIAGACGSDLARRVDWPPRVGDVVDDRQTALNITRWRRRKFCKMGVQAVRPFLSTVRCGLSNGLADLFRLFAAVAKP